MKSRLDSLEDLCAGCGKTIPARAKVHWFDLQKFCTKCYGRHGNLAHGRRPATEKQLQYISKIGLTPSPLMTVAEASEMISTATDIRQYLYLLVNQVWPGLDVYGVDLYPIVAVIYRDPVARGEAVSTYTRIIHNAFAQQAMVDKQNTGNPNYEQPYFGHFAAPVPRTVHSSRAVLGLAVILGKVTVDPLAPDQFTIPVEQQPALLGWLSDLAK
jgi:hypothetical protein